MVGSSNNNEDLGSSGSNSGHIHEYSGTSNTQKQQPLTLEKAEDVVDGGLKGQPAKPHARKWSQHVLQRIFRNTTRKRKDKKKTRTPRENITNMNKEADARTR